MSGQIHAGWHTDGAHKRIHADGLLVLHSRAPNVKKRPAALVCTGKELGTLSEVQYLGYAPDRDIGDGPHGTDGALQHGLAIQELEVAGFA